jgi:hypothetical protein
MDAAQGDGGSDPYREASGVVISTYGFILTSACGRGHRRDKRDPRRRSGLKVRMAPRCDPASSLATSSLPSTISRSVPIRSALARIAADSYVAILVMWDRSLWSVAIAPMAVQSEWVRNQITTKKTQIATAITNAPTASNSQCEGLQSSQGRIPPLFASST